MHIVYLCTPDRQHQLFTSLRSLYSSKTDFDRISIILVGERPAIWRKITDDRISIIEVDDIGKNFWMLNKLHLCNIEDNSFLFIDTDTLILRPINRLFEKNSDIIARTASYYTHHTWPMMEWRKYQKKFGSPRDFPYFNTGLIVFNNDAHKRLFDPWKKITTALLNDSDFPFGNRSHANQLAFSLAASSLGLTYDFLTKSEHAYGWAKEPIEDSLIYHTGNPKFLPFAVNINRQLHILDNGPDEFNIHIERAYFFYQLHKKIKKYQNKAKRVANKAFRLAERK